MNASYIENPNEDHIQAWKDILEVEAVEGNLFDRLRDGGDLLKKEFEEFPYIAGGIIQELYKKFTVTSLTYGTVIGLKSIYGFPDNNPWSIFDSILDEEEDN